MCEAATPSHISPLRRRFQRARLRTSTVVALRPMHGRAPACSAALLNVSADGIACRVPTDRRQVVAKNAALRVCFRLAEEEETYELPAVVVYRAEGGTAGYDVIGLQFADHDEAASTRQRLADALRRYSGQAAPRREGTI